MNGERPAEGVVIVRGTGEGFTQDIVAGSHRFLSDEPERAGGTDTGPTPYELLLASLGSCTSMASCRTPQPEPPFASADAAS